MSFYLPVIYASAAESVRIDPILIATGKPVLNLLAEGGVWSIAPMRHKLIYLVPRLAITAITILLILFFLEILVRAFWPQQLVQYYGDIYTADTNGLGYRKRAGVHTTINTGERTVQVFTDENGFRVGNTIPMSPDIRILAIGDSFLEAMQVSYEQTMTALLETRLSTTTGQTVQIVNTGVSGYQPDQYLILARLELARTRYDLVIVFVYLGNDIIDWQRDSIPAYQPQIRYRFRWPERFNALELRRAFLYPVTDFLESHSQLYIFVRERLDVLLARFGLRDEITPAIFISEQHHPRWANTVQILQKIAAEASVYHIPVRFVLLPAAYQVIPNEFDSLIFSNNLDRAEIDINQPRRLLAAGLQTEGLTVSDVSPALESAYQAGTRDLYGEVDPHFGLNGHRVVAEFLFPLILHDIAPEHDFTLGH